MKNKNLVFSVIALVGIIVLLIIPTGFEKQIYKNSYSAKGKVLNVNESNIYNTGMIKQGNQVCEIKILNGKHKGKVIFFNRYL